LVPSKYLMSVLVDTVPNSEDDRITTLATKESTAAMSSRPTRVPSDYLALALATWGVGYIPFAPGTFGSAVGVVIYALLRGLFLKVLFSLAARNRLDLLHIYFGLVTLELVSVVLITWIGIWAGSRAEKLFGKKDPGRVVVDEVAGQMLALLPVSLDLPTAWWSALLAFLLFRIFDIIKPYPARRFESLESGLGIMADDIVAGAYAAVVVAMVIMLRWFI